jgi:hypothetical protein
MRLSPSTAGRTRAEEGSPFRIQAHPDGGAYLLFTVVIAALAATSAGLAFGLSAPELGLGTVQFALLGGARSRVLRDADADGLVKTTATGAFVAVLTLTTPVARAREKPASRPRLSSIQHPFPPIPLSLLQSFLTELLLLLDCKLRWPFMGRLGPVEPFQAAGASVAPESAASAQNHGSFLSCRPPSLDSSTSVSWDP